MKKLLTISVLTLLAACDGKELETIKQENTFENLTYSVDTVQVDPGDGLINLGSGMGNYSLSPNNQQLFIFDWKRYLIQEIDLDNLKLANNFQYEKDGPDGIGANPPSFQSLRQKNFLIVSNGIKAGIFNKEGKKLQSLTFNAREIEGLDLPKENLITKQLTLGADGKHLFSLTSDFREPQIDLIVINPDSKTGKVKDIPSMDQAKASTIYYIKGNTGTVHGESVNLQLIKDNLYITNSANSDVYRYDYVLDSLRLYTFPHKLVSPRKTGTVKTNFSDIKEFEKERAKLLFQTTFDKLLWDDQREMFFRFAIKPIPDEENEWFDRSDIYLFAYDSDLVLLGEKHLENLKETPPSAFFKDGKLYSYVNVEDDLGFAVFTFNF
ncbi:DUF4221 family protein [Algoriphagus sp. C2-6-M1]|uniref:DUF4221 family protein n=1 Tax=Algoriphagus persicinus TaxID=3108754 RepID=UPI002B3AE80B|nr:DUF4221 family protein [Algoriphagus sp. C2-6-M1]MEB2779369.1 DUF4221 family protein [Algoriphagus sp. C2-6-M1]